MSIPLHKRLKSRTMIQTLVQAGNREKEYPIKMLYINELNAKVPGYEMAVTVPKRLVSSAVKRNRIKRVIREAWRLHISEMEQQLHDEKRKVSVMLIYMSAQTLGLPEAQLKINLLLERLKNAR